MGFFANTNCNIKPIPANSKVKPGDGGVFIYENKHDENFRNEQNEYSVVLEPLFNKFELCLPEDVAKGDKKKLDTYINNLLKTDYVGSYFNKKIKKETTKDYDEVTVRHHVYYEVASAAELNEVKSGFIKRPETVAEHACHKCIFYKLHACDQAPDCMHKGGWENTYNPAHSTPDEMLFFEKGNTINEEIKRETKKIWNISGDNIWE